MDRNVEMTVVQKLHIQKSNIVDTSSIDCVWYELEVTLRCDKTLPGLTIGPTVNLITFNLKLVCGSLKGGAMTHTATDRVYPKD